MKPRIGVYLSEQMAARLAAAAKRPGTSKSALVEAALAQFLGAGDDTSDLPVDRRLSLMSRQLEELDRGLRIVNETVALQTRFHLAVTPVLPAADQRTACVLGSERFDELAAQVRRRVQLGTSLMQETMDRLGTTKRGTATTALGGGAPQTCSLVQKSAARTSSLVGDKAESPAAVQEGGSLFNFPRKAGIPLQ
jgi:Ribbon-helix-helix protein, copG family